MVVLTPRDPWRPVTDSVMGGLSMAVIARMTEGETAFTRLKGEISTANGGGFAQMRADLPSGLGGRGGVTATLRGEGTFAIHLRPQGARRPWHVLRAPVAVTEAWADHRLAWADFTPSDREMAVPRGWGEVASLGVVALAPAGAFRIDLRRVAVHGDQ